MLRLRLLAASLALAALVPVVRAAEADDRAVENLAVFARLYGYVRFFHPSDEAAELDWDAFAVLGVEKIREAGDAAALQRALAPLFRPIAPTLRLSGPAGNDVSAVGIVERTLSERTTHWQHVGLQLNPNGTPDPGPYRSRRVSVGGRAELFPAPASRPTQIEKDLGSGLRVHLPLELAVASPGGRTLPAAAADDLAALKQQLAAVNLAQRDPARDGALRVAGAITAWNVFQHFHPYLDSTGIKWDDALRPALRATLAADSRESYYAALSALVAKLRDGHGYVYGRNAKLGGLPIRVAVLGDELVVLATQGDAPLRRGDIILEVDGVSAMDVVRERERHVSGSPHLVRFRALNQFGEGPLDSTAKVTVRRDGETLGLEIPRREDKRGFFFSSITSHEFPDFAEVRPGIFYVNLPSLDKETFRQKLDQLATARGVIFDQRWDGRMPKGNAAAAQASRLQPHLDIIPHLIEKTVQASPMRVPQVVAPDRAGWGWRESTWPVQPKAPRLTGRIVFINEPSVVSYGETCMAMIADYGLAKLVGEPTAGTNGNVGFIPLPGGFRIMWTGMEVLKHDRSHFYTVGFVPDYPVTRTLAAIKEGRDEFLAQAIAVIEAEPAKK
jgi:hypothetical protein